MKKILHLLSSGRVLGVILFLPMCVTANMAVEEKPANFQPELISTSSVSEATNLTDVTTVSQVPSRDYTSTLRDVTTTSVATTRRTRPEATTTTTIIITTTSNALTELLTNKACKPLLVLSFGLFLACFIFLMSTLLLAWKVCQLNKKIKTLSKNDELISNSDFWMGTAKRSKSKSETEAKETTVLMADIQQTEEGEKNGAVKEDGEKVNKDGQMEEEKKVGDASLSNEENKTAANSSSSNTQEKVADSKSTNAEAASPSEGTEQTQGGP